jgi:hypothetical protein
VSRRAEKLNSTLIDVTLRSGHHLHVVDGIGRGYSAVNIRPKVSLLTRGVG